jgi:hypothetical protein
MRPRKPPLGGASRIATSPKHQLSNSTLDPAQPRGIDGVPTPKIQARSFIPRHMSLSAIVGGLYKVVAPP